MRTFAALLDKEIRALFQAPIAWIVIGVFLRLMGYSFTATLFNNRSRRWCTSSSRPRACCC